MKHNAEHAEQSAFELGKFESVEQLLAAYNALEAEFTKRCQLVRELQAALSERAAQAEDAEKSGGAARYNAADTPQAVETAGAQTGGQSAVAAETSGAACDGAAREAAQAPARPCAERCNSDACATAARDGAERAENAERVESAAIDAGAALAYVAQNIAELAESLCELPELADACIARYKRRLMDARLVAVPRGAAVITPAKRPRTLDDAKRIADALLAGDGN